MTSPPIFIILLTSMHKVLLSKNQNSPFFFFDGTKMLVNMPSGKEKFTLQIRPSTRPSLIFMTSLFESSLYVNSITHYMLLSVDYDKFFVFYYIIYYVFDINSLQKKFSHAIIGLLIF